MPEPVGKAPSWYPAWKGETITIVAAGPSAPDVNLDAGIGHTKFVAINNSWKLCPWADAIYAADYEWWVHNRQHVPKDKRLKICVDPRILAYNWGVTYLQCEKPDDNLLLSSPGVVGWGGNSGFNCLNWVAQLSPSKIIFVGFDMTREFGMHWHQAHGAGLSNPTNHNIFRWRRAVDRAAKPLREAGISVLNCSPISRLINYPRMRFEEALDYVPGTPFPEPPPLVEPPGGNLSARAEASVEAERIARRLLEKHGGPVDERLVKLVTVGLAGKKVEEWAR